MESSDFTAASLGIAALPASTTRQLGSGQVLVDPSSVVKELIDNALDARAKSIFVDITLNTIDSIQVKDDGHGIASEDRALACRRYCTSKIRDFHDLRDVGGKWLGFRGEALASLAGMSQTLSVTTRVEGEPVAVKLKYGRDGELLSTERDSHPVGTTVKATHFLEQLPVRKQTAIKNSSKVLVKIRRLMQSYALARPTVRFRLHILKAQNNKSDFIYAPSANANVEDAALKIIGKTCALQCEWTAAEADGYEIHAFLPKPQAAPSKISGPGPFVAVDSRPLASNRGTVKKFVTMFKEYLFRSSSAMSGVKEPFFCMNVICPSDSYDPNVEPAKDNVMFDNENAVLTVVRKLLDVFYPSLVADESENEPSTSAQRPPENVDEDNADLSPSTAAPLQDVTKGFGNQPRWRSSMYGVDEDDLEYLQENHPPIIEDDAGIRDVAVSNPWTIARMNAFRKPHISAPTVQLPSPAKTSVTDIARSSSPSPHETPRGLHMAIPMTPSGAARHRPIETEQPILTSLPIRGLPSRFSSDNHDVQDDPLLARTLQHGTNHVQPASRARKSSHMPFVSPVPSSKPHQSRKGQQVNRTAGLRNGGDGPDYTWFGQPMAGSQPTQSRLSKTKRKALQEPPLFPTEHDTSSNIGIIQRNEQPQSELLTPANNTDIRDFFTGHGYTQNPGGDDSSSFVDRVAGLTHNSPDRSSSNPRLSLPIAYDSASSLTPHGQGQGQGLLSSPVMKPDTPQMLNESPSLMAQSNPQTHSQSSDMQAHFAAYQACEDGFNNALHLKPRDNATQVPSHEEASRGRKVPSELRRRKSSNGALARRKSSRAPLERVPRGYHMHNVVKVLSSNARSIQHDLQEVDILCNGPSWRISPLTAYNVFIDVLTEDKIAAWVHRLDIMLHSHFDRLPGTDVQKSLQEGIYRGLAAKKRDANMDIMPPSFNTYTSIAQGAGTRQVVGTPVPEEHLLAAQEKVGQWMDDFDMSQFVHFDSDAGDEGMGKVDGEDDDMLMGD